MSNINKNNFKEAIILAAGRGIRMRYKTKFIAKPLVKIQNKHILEVNLNKLKANGVKNCTINTSYKHKTIKQFIKNFNYKNKFPLINATYEINRLETGGGIKNALPYFREDKILVINGDSLLINDKNSCPINKLYSYFDAKKMDILLLLCPIRFSIGYNGYGDYDRCSNSLPFEINRRKESNRVSLVFTGWQIIKKELFEKIKIHNFSLNLLFNEAEKKNRLYAINHVGSFLHLSTPKSILQVESYLKNCNHIL
ncbi:MAG: hypothetical protein CMP40_01715 [Rickettsiales bacterium]|nr:hypothetical protein [Rickettsiales bacterium]|tara:strand:+ start:851 stop:1612 length:762 start_codon:yes stop_codon:yes gene_type:complete